jgi:PAS domain S-box-containing protein
MSKKALINRLIKAERQLRTVGAEKEPVRAPASRRRAGKISASENRPVPASVRKEAKSARSARPAAADIKSASESDYTILDTDGHIRRLYKVVKDIQDDKGNSVFSEGALYEINSKSHAVSDIDHPDVAGESDRTELICRFRPNGSLTYVNEAYCRYFGVEKEDLHGRNVLLSISEADREQVYSRLKDLRPERPVDTLEYRVASVFGDILWNQWTYRALFDESGNILEYQSVGRDITFRKYTQEILEKRAAILEAVTFAAEGFLKGSSWRDRIERVLERFGAAMNASHVFLCENRIGEGGDIAVLHSYEWLSPQVKGTRNRQKFLRNSKLAIRFSRWVYEKSEGRPIYGTIGQFPDKDVEALSLDRKLSIAVIPVLMGERWWGYMGFADYSGDSQWTDDEIAPLGAASEILGAAIEREEKERALEETHATIRDQERFLAGVFDGIQDGLSVLAPDLTILRVNSTMENWFSDAAPLVGMKCFEAYQDRKRPCRDCPVKKTLETGKAASHVFPRKSPGGEIKAWFEVFSYPWIDEKTGAMRGVIEYLRDITEKKKAEEAQRQSEERLRQFIDSSRDVIFLKDENFRYLVANKACLAFSGAIEEDIVGKTDFELFTEEQARTFREGDQAALAGGDELVTHGIVFMDRFMEVTKFPVELEDGRVGVGGIVRDVTEQRLAAEKIRRSEELLRTFIDSSRDYIYLKDDQGRNILVNRAVTEFFRRGEEDIIGRTDAELLPAAQAERSRDSDRKVLEAGRALSFYDREQGRIFEVMKFPVRFADDRTGIGGILRDITEKIEAEERVKRSEERLRTFIDSSKDFIFLKDADFRYLFMNKEGINFYGFGDETVLLGKTDYELFPKQLAGELRRGDLAAMRKKTGPAIYDLVMNDRILAVTKFKVRLADGRIGVGGIAQDVTERKKVEESLRMSEARYRELADTIPAGVYEATVDGYFTYANRTAMEMYGYGEDDIRKRIHFLQVVAPEDHETAKRRLQAVRDDQPLPYTDYTFVRKNGSRFPGLLMSKPLKRNGQVVGLMGVVTDISALKEAQTALRKNETMMRSIMKAAPVGIAFGRERTLQWSNEYYQRMTGYGEDDVSGRTARLLYESDEEFQRVGKELYGSIGKDGIGEAQTRWKRRDGSMIDVLLSVSPLDSDDVAQGVVISALDVTEKKKADEALRASEARYRELADNIPVGIYEATFDGVVQYANNTALEMFGYSADDVAKGVNFLAVISPNERDTLIRHVQKVRQEGSIIYQEYTMVRKDGSRFAALNTARPLVHEGRVVGSTGIVTDISELKAAQEALRKNEALLKSIVQAAPIGVGMVHDRVLEWVNDGMTQMTGYAVGELKGKSARVLYPDQEEFERAGREKYAEIAARGKGAVETCWKRKDGTIIDVHLSSAPIDPADLAAGVVFTALDITTQKKAARILLFAKEDLEKQVAEQTRELDVANMLLKLELEEHHKTEEALVNSEQLYRAIVEDQTEFICRFRPDGALSFVNEAFCRFFGKKREELLWTRYRPTPPEDQRMIKAALRSLNPENPVIHVEVRTERPDGEIRWMQWTNRAIYDGAGNLVEHQAVGRDITDRKRSELQIRESRNMLRAVFDGISDPLVMVREDMTLIMLNRAALSFFGALLYRDVIGTSCLESFQGRYGQEASGLVRSAITEERPARYDLETRGDSARYEEVFVYPVHDSGGDHNMAIIRITDRTKQRLMERELIQSEKLASLGLLISGIVHEINNPNNFISFNIPILNDYLQEILPVLDEHAARTPHYEVQGMAYVDFRNDVMKLLENIEHGSVRINTTVAKLKEFSRKKDDRGARPILPTGVVERAVAICHTQIRKTVKTFDVQVQQDMPEMVSDPDAIEQTLINLLINAAQAADKPDSHIRLDVRRGASGKEGLVLEVEDNGCGMDAKTAARVFDPFFTTKEEGLGTGLGLYISKNLVESVGGSISVESEIGRGATFRVVIPDLGNPDRSKITSEQRGVGA